MLKVCCNQPVLFEICFRLASAQTLGNWLLPQLVVTALAIALACAAGLSMGPSAAFLAVQQWQGSEVFRWKKKWRGDFVFIGQYEYEYHLGDFLDTFGSLLHIPEWQLMHLAPRLGHYRAKSSSYAHCFSLAEIMFWSQGSAGLDMFLWLVDVGWCWYLEVINGYCHFWTRKKIEQRRVRVFQFLHFEMWLLSDWKRDGEDRWKGLCTGVASWLPWVSKDCWRLGIRFWESQIPSELQNHRYMICVIYCSNND